MKFSANKVLIILLLLWSFKAYPAADFQQPDPGTWENFTPSQKQNVIKDWIEKSANRKHWSHAARKEFALSAYVYAQKIHHTPLKMEAMYNLTELYLNEAQFEQASLYLDSLEAYAIEYNNVELLIKTDNLIATIHRHRGEWLEALNLCFDAYILAKNNHLTSLIALTANNLGVINRNLGEKKSALNFYTEALDLATHAADTNQIISALSGLGHYFWFENETEQALEYYLKSLAVAEKYNDLQHIASLYNNLGNIYRQKANYDKALLFYNKAFNMLDEVNVTGLKAIILRNIGLVFQRQGNIEFALDNLMQSSEIFISIGILPFLKENYLSLSQLFQQKGNIHEAYKYLVLHTDLDKKINEGLTNNRISYFNEKLFNAKQKEDYYRYKSKTNMYIIVIILLVMASLGFISFLYYRRTKENKKQFKRIKNTLQDKIIVEKALRKSEESFQTLIKTLNEGLIVLDKNNKIEFLNNKAQKILGGQEEYDLNNRSFEDFLLSSDDHKLFHEKSELQKMGISDQYEIKMKNTSGDVLWAHLSSAPILDENQHVQGTVTLVTDITERKKSEQTYGELTASLNQKIKQLNCLYDITDISGVPGITFEEIMAKSLEIIPVGLRYSHDIGVQIVFDNKTFTSRNFVDTPWSYSVPIKVQKKKLGSLKVAYTEEKPAINKDPFHFSEKILLKNISEKLGKIIESKNLEKVLKENQEKLQEVQKIAKIGNWEIDLVSGNSMFSEFFFDVVQVSPERRKFFDFSKLSELIHPDDKEVFYNFIKRITAGDNKDVTANYRIISNKGSIIFIFSSGKIIFNEKQEKAVCVFTVQDITEQKYAQELKHHAELALKTSEAKQHIVANISYEMRTPITGILGLIDFLTESDLNSRQIEMVRNIKDSGNVLLNSVNNILDLQRIETGKFRLNNTSFSVEQLMNKISSLFTALTRSKEINLVIDIHPDIPAKITSDPERIYQVITSLISIITDNAGGKGTLSISLRPHNPLKDKMMILVEITDNFSNINISDARIALTYGQEDVLMQKKDIVLVGLAISRKLVDMLEGTIGVEKKKQKGTRFHFSFSATLNDQPGFEHNLNRNHDNLKGIKILCAEDQKINQKVLALMLAHAQCEVTMVNNGKEVIDMLNNHTFDIILLDMVMPVMDGVETLNTLKKDAVPHPPIIALSANVMEEDRERYYFAGVYDFISKPINADELYAKIDKWHKVKTLQHEKKDSK
jgi:PAS domain S-box-containing protein